MATTVLTVRAPEEIKARLDKLAQATRRSKSYLAEEAIVRYLELEAWQVGEINQALVEAGREDFATADELNQLLKRYTG